MNNRFTENAQNVLNKAPMIAGEMGHTYIGSEHILMGLLAVEDCIGAKLLEKYGATRGKVKDIVASTVGVGEKIQNGKFEVTPRTKRILENSGAEARSCGQSFIGTEHLLMALLREGDSEAVKILMNIGVNVGDLYKSALNSGSLGSDYGGEDNTEKGYTSGTSTHPKAKNNVKSDTPNLNQYGTDLTERAKDGKLDPVIGREEEMQRVVQILSRRTKNNPCLIGEPGVGKTAVAEGLALKIAEGDVPETLKNKRVVSLDLSGMLAGAKYRGEFEERIKNVCAEIKKAKDVVLFIDEIHTLVGAGAAEGAIDAANILKPALSRGEIQVVGATTLEEYRKYIEKDAALERRFQSVTVGEPSKEEAILILSGLRDKYEAHHKIKITDEAIEASVNLSSRYISDRFLPDKAIDLIDEACSRKRIITKTMPKEISDLEAAAKKLCAEKEEAVRAQDFEKAAEIRNAEREKRKEFEVKSKEWQESVGFGSSEINENDIAEIVTLWTGIPVKKLEDEESEKLLRLDEILKSRVIGQDEAVSVVSRAIRRGRTGLKDPKRPQGSFIFAGPTGVGKTELSKALAQSLFGDENAIIRIDMSEYMEKHSVSKLIGSPPGYVGFDEAGQLTEKIRRHPYSVVLFDEIEKAHPDVFNILLQVLDDGILTDSHGRRVDFKNCVIIMTTNAGSSDVVESKPLGFNSFVDNSSEYEKSEKAVNSSLKNLFRPEFLNRIDEIVVFHKLSDENIKQIASLMLGEIAGRINNMGITISFSDEVVEYLAKEGFDPVYGARPLRRAIQRKLEDSFSIQLLEGNIKGGDKVKATLVDGSIVYKKAAKKQSK